VEKASARAARIIDQILSLSTDVLEPPSGVRTQVHVQGSSVMPAIAASGASPVGAARPASVHGLHVVQGTHAPQPADMPAHHILYVDDEESLVYLVKRMLERQGYRVAGFTDAREALACLQRTPDEYQAVVTDLSMPGMSGVEFTREVLQLRPALPVVMTSGYVRAEDRDSVMACGVRELLLKPNTVEELAQVLHRLLQQVAHTTVAAPMRRSLGAG
jgi:CheY-like chemotaxis protein